MNKTIAVVIAVIVVVGGIYYFATQNSPSAPAVQTPSPTTTAAPSVPAPNTAPTASAAVSIQNFSFNPSSLSVTTGTTVVWTNNDTVPHTVTSDTAGLFNSQAIPPGQSFSYTFAAPGSVSYHCSIHPMMKGTVSVQ